MQIDFTLLLVLGELLLLSGVTALSLLVLKIIAYRRDRKAAASLIQNIKKDEPRRKEKTKEVLNTQFGFEDETLRELTTKIHRGEIGFYQRLINLYIKRDASALELLKINFEQSVEGYRSLQPELVVENIIEDEELEILREQNAQLRYQLQVTMGSMGKMLSRYATIFSGAAGPKLDHKAVIEILREEHEKTQKELSAVADQEDSTEEELDYQDGTDQVEELEGGATIDQEENPTQEAAKTPSEENSEAEELECDTLEVGKVEVEVEEGEETFSSFTSTEGEEHSPKVEESGG